MAQNNKKMSDNWIIGIIIFVVFLFFMVFEILPFMERKQVEKVEPWENQTPRELTIKFSNETPEIWYYLSEDYKNITINGEACYEVPCDCHRNNPSCLLICYYCEDE